MGRNPRRSNCWTTGSERNFLEKRDRRRRASADKMAPHLIFVDQRFPERDVAVQQSGHRALQTRHR